MHARLAHPFRLEDIRPSHFVNVAKGAMQAPALAVEEMKRAGHDLNMPGFQIGSHIHRALYTVWGVHSVMIFLTCSACRWADTAATVQSSW